MHQICSIICWKHVEVICIVCIVVGGIFGRSPCVAEPAWRNFFKWISASRDKTNVCFRLWLQKLSGLGKTCIAERTCVVQTEELLCIHSRKILTNFGCSTLFSVVASNYIHVKNLKHSWLPLQPNLCHIIICRSIMSKDEIAVFKSQVTMTKCVCVCVCGCCICVCVYVCLHVCKIMFSFGQLKSQSKIQRSSI